MRASGALQLFMLLSLLVAAVRDLGRVFFVSDSTIWEESRRGTLEMVARLGVWSSKSQYLFGHGEKASLNRPPLC